MIAFSYELGKRENKPGTPERPLSDLGYISYRSFWTRVLLNVIKTQGTSLSIKHLSENHISSLDVKSLYDIETV